MMGAMQLSGAAALLELTISKCGDAGRDLDAHELQASMHVVDHLVLTDLPTYLLTSSLSTDLLTCLLAYLIT